VWLLVGALSIAGVAAGVLLALIQARRLSRPLDSIARVSAELGAGDFSVRAQTFGIPEIDAVVTALNQSAEQIAELVGAERRFASAVSHQLRTPLTALRLRLEELVGSAGNEPAAAEARAALAQTDRLTATIDELLSLTRRGRTGNKVKLDLSTLVQVHVDSWRSQLDLADRKLVATNGPSTLVTATPGALGQALDVLLDNALKHGAGAVTTEVTREDGRAIVRVSDQGRGIDPALAERIFEWNTSSAGTLGIGLSLARALVESQGGRLDLVEMHPATFEISIPTAE
jgi:signal transduction histidine kinase